jgi:hypothetical protein
MPFGADEIDTAEFMLGRVAVTPVFLESNGQIDPSVETWTAQSKSETFQKIVDGLDFWVDLLATKSSIHTLEWVYDQTFIDNPASTAYEPIQRRSDDYQTWVPEFLTSQGYAESNGIESNILAFNHAQRVKLGTDWSFTIFVVNSTEDIDDSFAAGGSMSRAFAFAGGLFEVIPSGRPASTFAHETGHIFWARDEYSGGARFTDRRGYYDAQATNAIDWNQTPNFTQADSIMSSGAALDRAFEQLVSPDSTLAHIGWQDTDQDGIFDVLDVPLKLTGVGRYQPGTQNYNFSGQATVQTLANKNSSGLGNSITLNKITDIQYRIGSNTSWTTIRRPNAYTFDSSFNIAITAADIGQTIEIRAIDSRIGISSNIFTTTISTEAQSHVGDGLHGFVWDDSDADGVFAASENGRSNWTVELRSSDDRELNLYTKVNVDELPRGTYQPGSIANVDLADDGIDGALSLTIGPGINLPGNAILPVSAQNGRTLDAWNSLHTLDITSPEAFSKFEIEVLAVSDFSRIRIRTYDANSDMLTSESYGLTPAMGIQWIGANDSQARIRRVTIELLASSVAELGSFNFGIPTVIKTDTRGAFQFDTIASGDYLLKVVPTRTDIYIHTNSTSGTHTVQYNSAEANRSFGVNLPPNAWANPSLPQDVNADGRISILDLHKLVNFIRRYGSVVLEQSNQPITEIVDANLDRRFSILDLLEVVNHLNSRNRRASGEASATPIIASNVAIPSPTPIQSTTSNHLTSEGEQPVSVQQLQSAPTNVTSLKAKSNNETESTEYMSAIDQSMAMFNDLNNLDHLSCGCSLCGCC